MLSPSSPLSLSLFVLICVLFDEADVNGEGEWTMVIMISMMAVMMMVCNTRNNRKTVSSVDLDTHMNRTGFLRGCVVVVVFFFFFCLVGIQEFEPCDGGLVWYTDLAHKKTKLSTIATEGNNNFTQNESVSVHWPKNDRTTLKTYKNQIQFAAHVEFFRKIIRTVFRSIRFIAWMFLFEKFFFCKWILYSWQRRTASYWTIFVAETYKTNENILRYCFSAKVYSVSWLFYPEMDGKERKTKKKKKIKVHIYVCILLQLVSEQFLV